MYSLSQVRKLLARQWLQSVLLHVALVICAVLYHFYNHGSLHLDAHSFDTTGTDAITTLRDNNADFIELSLDQYEMTETQQTEAEPAEEPIDVLIDTLIDEPINSLIDVPLEVQRETPVERLIAAPMKAPKDVSFDVTTRASKKSKIEVVKATAPPVFLSLIHI